MHILIADDERIARIGLETMLNKLYPYENTYVHAKNGKEVLEKIKSKPDLVFLDIKMPVLQGLEAMEQLYKEYPLTQWVIVSGYADFEYAHKAIALSASAYILKPIDIKQIKEVVDKIKGQLNEQFESTRQAFNHFIVNTFLLADNLGEETIDFEQEKQLLFYTIGDYHIYAFYQDLCDEDKHKITIKECFDLINNVLKSKKEHLMYSVFFDSFGTLCLIIKNDNNRHINRLIQETFSYMLQKKYLTIFSASDKTIKGLYTLKTKISEISTMRIFIPTKSIISIELINVVEQERKLSQVIEQICFFCSSGDAVNAKSKLNKLSTMEIRNIFNKKEMVEQLSLFLSSYFSLQVSLKNDIELIHFFDKQIEAISNNFPAKNDCVIECIKQYLNQNYMNDISLTEIGDFFDLSPTYLSKLFHQKTSMKYIDYLTDIRMNKAKVLLTSNKAISVKEVAENVGYNSVRHFSKTFLKYFGVLPSQIFFEK